MKEKNTIILYEKKIQISKKSRLSVKNIGISPCIKRVLKDVLRALL